MRHLFFVFAFFASAVLSSNIVRVVQSARDTGDRLTTKPSLKWVPDKPAPAVLTIDSSVTFQKIIGFGGAFTESAAHNIAQMSPAKQQEIINAYFGPEGNFYTIGRVHMNSCDFSLSSYSYDDTPGDYSLRQFNISHDLRQIVPLVQRALNTTVADVKMFLSPWSPPAWMKPNNAMCSSPTPGLIQDPKIFASWALYFSKFISAYKQLGIPFWGLTVQNEPGFAETNPWEACGYTAENERDFVRDYLGPRLAADHPDVKIMIFDHNKDDVYSFAKVVLADPAAAKYVAGTAFHWYSGDEFENLDATHALNPDKFLLATEACLCPPDNPGNWSRGEIYGHDIIGDLNHWSTGWVDWNMVLDMKGGPNHVNNFCAAPIHVDAATDTVYYMPPYYYMGHFSRFLMPNSLRIKLTIDGAPDLEATAFVVSGVQIVIVAMNPTDAPISFKVLDPDFAPNMAVFATVPAHGIQTLSYALRC